MDEFRISPLGPSPWSGVDFVRKHTYGNGDLDILGREKGEFVFPIETGRRNSGVRQPIERDVIEDIVPGKAGGFPGKDTRDEFLAASIVVQDPAGETNR